MKDRQTNELLDTLMKCIAACETCADRSLEVNQSGEMNDCIRTARDCAEVCSTTARFVARNSHLSDELLQICITICKTCKTKCSEMDYEHCKVCATVCDECISACRAYELPGVNA